MRSLSSFIIKPIISEKSFAEAKQNRYTFVVAKDANKTDVRNAIEHLFGVTVKHVYTANIKGTRTRSTRYGKRSIDATYKKARVALLAGQKIDIFEEKTEDDKKKGKQK